MLGSSDQQVRSTFAGWTKKPSQSVGKRARLKRSSASAAPMTLGKLEGDDEAMMADRRRGW